MELDDKGLDALFAPMPGERGTHLLICGLSADVETLERAMAIFTGEEKIERAATGRLRGLLMLDASQPRPGPVAIPGLAGLAPCPVELWAKRTSLMHAKVALMGFAHEPFAAPTSFRLVVSTGNWTRETWGSQSQIDLFWSTTWRINEVGELAEQARTDITEAYRFFDRLMSGLYSDARLALGQRHGAMQWLVNWRTTLLRRRSRPGPSTRFVHSLDKTMLEQIEARFPANGISTLVAGSGFFEQPASDETVLPSVLAHLETLTKASTRYLVFNPSNAGALAGWIRANPPKAESAKIGNWTLCTPIDPLATGTAPGRTRLHAKYIAGLTRTYSNGKGSLGGLYIGSGNLSRQGLLSHARLDATAESKKAPGNVETGIVERERLSVANVWKALACGDEQPRETLDAVDSGEAEPTFEPRDPPPVLLAQIDAGTLHFMRGSSSDALQFCVPGENAWHDVAAQVDQAPAPWHDATPPSYLLVRTPGRPANGTHEVPVMSQGGLLCRQAPPQVGVDDVLEALLAFPAAPPFASDDEVPPKRRGKTPPGRSPAATRYPLQRLAALIEAVAQRNVLVTREQFPVWLSELRMLLLEQTLEADREAIRSLGVDLFDALFEPGFVPPWLDDVPEYKREYATAIAAIRRVWTTSATPERPNPQTEHETTRGDVEEAA